MSAGYDNSGTLVLHITQELGANDESALDSWRGRCSCRRCWLGRSFDGTSRRRLGKGMNLWKKKNWKRTFIQSKAFIAFVSTYFLAAGAVERTVDADKALTDAPADLTSAHDLKRYHSWMMPDRD